MTNPIGPENTFDPISEAVASFETDRRGSERARRDKELAKIEEKRAAKRRSWKIAKALGIVAAVPTLACSAMYVAHEYFDEDNCEDNIPTLHDALSDGGYSDEEILDMSDAEVNAALYEMGVTGNDNDQELNNLAHNLTIYGACSNSGTTLEVSTTIAPQS